MEEKKHILIVDDDIDLCDMLVKYFTIKDFETDVAYSGEKALNMVYNNHYDMIILDIMMPGMDGYEVCQRLKIRREYNRIPILMLSAKSTDQDKIVGFKTGADAYITKPFDITKLYKSVIETMDKCRRSQEIEGIKHEINFQFESRFQYLEQVNDLISQLFRRTQLASDEIWEIKLALHELAINAIEHGNKMDPRKQVIINCCIYDNKLEFEIEDEGEGFDVKNLPDPTAEEGLCRDRGRGIYLVSKLVNEIEYDKGGSKVRLIRYINKDKTNCH